VALRTGLYLAQAGEFGFVLLTLGLDHRLIEQRWAAPVLASMVLSMLATPFVILYSNRIVMRLASSDWLMQSVALTTIAKRSIQAEKHIIICGYGRSGQNLARMLEVERMPYMALDLDPDRVRQAAAAGQNVVFGDAARLASLMAAGLARASAVVVCYHDTPSSLKVLHLVQSHAPRVPVIVRTIDDAMRATACCAATSTARTTTRRSTSSSRPASPASPCRPAPRWPARRWASPPWKRSASRSSRCGCRTGVW
jgi:CPA2 family monovalent cation:H+ antiporter-2